MNLRQNLLAIKWILSNQWRSKILIYRSFDRFSSLTEDTRGPSDQKIRRIGNGFIQLGAKGRRAASIDLRRMPNLVLGAPERA